MVNSETKFLFLRRSCQGSRERRIFDSNGLAKQAEILVDRAGKIHPLLGIVVGAVENVGDGRCHASEFKSFKRSTKSMKTHIAGEYPFAPENSPVHGLSCCMNPGAASRA